MLNYYHLVSILVVAKNSVRSLFNNDFLLAVIFKSGTAGNLELTDVAGVYLNIFTANSMECEGWVTAWVLYSKGTGQIYLGLWDNNPDGHTFTLTGKNLVTVGSSDIGQSKVFLLSTPRESCVSICSLPWVNIQ